MFSMNKRRTARKAETSPPPTWPVVTAPAGCPPVSSPISGLGARGQASWLLNLFVVLETEKRQVLDTEQ